MNELDVKGENVTKTSKNITYSLRHRAVKKPKAGSGKLEILAFLE